MNTTTPAPWAPTEETLRVRALCRRYALSERLARLLAGLAYGGAGMTGTNITPPELRVPKHTRQAVWRERNQLKVWAHGALRSALRRGLHTQQPSEVCGAKESEAHRPDHAKALDMQWLCRAHHKQVHAQERKSA